MLSTPITPEAFLSVALPLLRLPTAPFHEEAVSAEIHLQLAQLPHVFVERDPYGNLIAEYKRGDAEPLFAFAAHMDHPAYVGDRFLGGVPEAYLKKQPPVRDHGAFRTWDLPEPAVTEGLIHAPACDDLIGCAAIVAMFQELERKEAPTACLGVFTRGEEVGFAGAIQLARSDRISPDVTIVSLETSSQKSGLVKMGEGVIVRVGDRSSIFDSNATAFLWQTALAAEIPAQRALMSGGTCEATAYQLYDYCAAGLCVALGNYHNCGPEETIASEYVSLEDCVSLTRLCVAAAGTRQLPNPTRELREKLEKNLKEYLGYF